MAQLKAGSTVNNKLIVTDDELTSTNITRPDNSTIEEGLQALDEVINKSLVWEERYTPSVKTLNAYGWRSVFSARTTPILEVGKYLVMINMGFKGISSGLGTVRGLVDGSEYRNARMSFPLGSGSILTDVTVTFLLTITNRKTYTISCDIYPTVSCENRNYPVQIILLRVG